MTDAATTAPAEPAFRLEQTGRWDQILPIVVKNAILNIFTLSFYRFWGKTAVRQFIWRHTKFMDEGLEYTGTGVELLIGFLVVAVVILLPLGLFNFFAQQYLDPTGPAFFLATALIYVFVVFLIGQAIFRARRYRLSRTVWRGIRGGIDGSPHLFGLFYLGYTVLLAVSLGWAYPWMRVRIFERLMSQSLFGNRYFKVDISAAPLYGRFAVLWFVAAVTIIGPLFLVIAMATLAQWELIDPGLTAVFAGVVPFLILFGLIPAALAFAWYRVGEYNLFAQSTSFEGLRFKLDATFGSLLRLVIGNFFIMWISFGFGQPFTQLRMFRYACARMTLNGDLDVEAIRQSQLERPGVGEGLADAFDMGAV
jgi:uncharacterized membrane protein YjgN (DUF898 family)